MVCFDEEEKQVTQLCFAKKTLSHKNTRSKIIKYLMQLNLCFVIFFYCASANSAAIQLTPEIEKLAPYVTQMVSLGNWYVNEQAGYYRIIYINWYYGNSLLYVQWMQNPNQQENLPKTVYTLSIEEFNRDDHLELEFKMPKIKLDRDGLTLFVNATNSHDQKIYHYKIKIFKKPGCYNLEKK